MYPQEWLTFKRVIQGRALLPLLFNILLQSREKYIHKNWKGKLIADNIIVYLETQEI